MKRLRRKHIIKLNKKHRNQETPVFERLEPRLLLNADMTGLAAGQNIVPLTTDQSNNVIEADLQSNSLVASAALTPYVPQSVPYTQDFSSGKPNASQGWEYYSDNQGQIQVVGGRLRLDDSVADYSYSLNEAILHLDLTGKTDVKLTLDHISLADENDPLPTIFSGHYQGDGIALSVDGVNWVTVTNLTSSFTAGSFNLDSIIAQAKTAAGGSTDVSDVRIKFQQYDNSISPYDGREFDNIKVTSVNINVQNVPYSQDFSFGKPGISQGWEYYSSNQGQIQVVGGRLRLDDSVADYSYSLNEAILHVNLTNMKDVTLTLDHYSLADENDALPTIFSDHYQGDGIALSVDGIHWVTVLNLTSSFTAQTYSLDSIIEEAKAEAGSTDVSNVRIKFQQYDNSVSPYDGREFDNIQVNAVAVQQLPYTQDFSAGKPNSSKGWEYYSSNQGQIQVVGGRLRLDDSVSDYSYSLNEAILHVDLTNMKQVKLTLDHYSLADENDALPGQFTGHYQGDGIALSVDGVHWITITSLTTSFTNKSFNLDSIVEQAKTAAGSTDVSNVRIKFQQYDNTYAPADGREFDNIKLTGISVQNLPYTQDFSAGKPNASQGWEYYSDNQGQIQVIGGSLRLDDSVADNSPSLNEAILHVDLTNMTNVKLTLDHTSLSDENDAIPAIFSGHYQGDGIALSVDGVNWVTITSLTTSFTGQTFNLDSIIAQAKTAAGSTDVSNVRIKFQQYDNTYAPNDGREFDNIQITGLAVQSIPYEQDFESGKPDQYDGWEFYSDNQGQIQVLGGKLRLDDSGSDYIYSLNEAILHVNLTGKNNVTLTLDHTSLADENDPLPTNFTNHYQGDGIALSVDGIHWVTVTSLTGSFTGQSFSLDTIIAQAITDAGGSSDLSDVRIKFQQYDNTFGPYDGREFDNIQITTS